MTLHISPDALSLSRGLSRRNHRPWSHKFAIRSQQLTQTRLSSLDKYCMLPTGVPFRWRETQGSARNKRNSPKERLRLTIETFVPTFAPCAVSAVPPTHIFPSVALRPCHLPMSNPPPPCHRQANLSPLSSSPNRMSANYRHLSACNARRSAHVAAENMRNLLISPQILIHK